MRGRPRIGNSASFREHDPNDGSTSRNPERLWLDSVAPKLKILPATHHRGTTASDDYLVADFNASGLAAHSKYVLEGNYPGKVDEDGQLFDFTAAAPTYNNHLYGPMRPLPEFCEPAMPWAPAEVCWAISTGVELLGAYNPPTGRALTLMDTTRTRTIQWQDPAETLTRASDRSGLEMLQAMARELPMPPIAVRMGFTALVVSAGSAAITFRPAEYHYNPVDATQGGVAVTVLDAAMWCAVQSTVPALTVCQTLDMTVRYVRSLRPTSVRSPLRPMSCTEEARSPLQRQRSATTVGSYTRMRP